MSGKEKELLLTFLTLAGITGLVLAVGAVAVFVVVPLFVIALIIDSLMRSSYNRKLKAYEAGAGKAVSEPAISSFDTRYHEGQVLVGWLVELPEGTKLEIFRRSPGMNDADGGALDLGTCIHSTGNEYTYSKDDLFIDHEAGEGVHVYTPVIEGQHVVKTPIPYSLFNFMTRLEFTSRKLPISARGNSVRLVVPGQIEEKAIVDHRDDATRLADDILGVIAERKQRENSLDLAIARIRDDASLSDDEKEEAIELLETRIGAK